MNILFVSGHPAQVHNFRLVREELIKDGHQVFWLTTPKDIATNLLDIYGIPYERLHKPSKGLVSKAWTLLRNVIWEMGFLRRNKIDVAITRTCPYTTIAAKLCGVKHIIIDDTEHAAHQMKRFSDQADAIVVPDCFWFQLRKDELRFPGNIELHYLHPKRFSPKPVWNLLGVEPNTRFAIVRFVKWDAWHDTQLVGGFTLDQKRTLIQRLQAHMRVFISSESELPADLEPYRIHIPIEQMHHVQAAAALFVGESATMASESVCLGTPAIYIDQVGRGYTDEEAREQLLWMFRPVKNRSALQESEPDWISGGVEECIDKAEELADAKFDVASYAKRHKAWMAMKIDCTAFLTWFIEN
jgi:predicted glycosyltransferase